MKPNGKKTERKQTVKKGKIIKQKGKKHERKPIDKKGRIVIRNISFKSSKDDIQNHFSQFGTIREVNLLLRPDGNPVGCGFVQFNSEDDAAQAIKQCTGKDFMGRKIAVDWALQRDHFIVSRPTPTENDELSYEKAPELKINATNHVHFEEDTFEPEDTKPDIKEEMPGVDEVESKQVSKQKRRKDSKLLNQVKKGRVIVRNLPFKITEDGLRKHFNSYGELNEVTILRRPNGLMVGCGFIQFADRKNAAKAIVECSGKPLLGRPIVLDWAIQKNLYKEKNPKQEQVTIKTEEKEDEETVNELDETQSVKSESDDEDIKAGSESEEDDQSDNDDVDEDEEADEDDEDVKEEDDEEEKPTTQRPKVISNDVSEGRTVFLRNVPFSATNDDLKECMEKYGLVCYALICVDRMTEHSKGTAFVKFMTTESAQLCLSAGTELKIHGQVLDPHQALNREDINSKATKKLNSKSSQDNRNLFLVKEGVILAGTPAAASVSVTDMAKRLQLEQWKSQMLRNLNMFVARDRLAIHNLPPSYDDTRLKDLFLKHGGPNAVIKEARVMRDMRNRDLEGVAKSKETGFVKFSTHEAALEALRKINNNPTIFSKNKRPIVAFSIENRAIHKVRQQRELKSRAKNPTFTKNTNEEPSGTVAIPKKSFSKVETRKQKRNKNRLAPTTEAEEFSGMPAKPGNTKFRSKFKLRVQAEEHTQAVRKDKNKAKSNKRFIEQKKIHQESIRQPKQKQGKKVKNNNDASFNKLVNKYVTKIASSTSSVKNKWYEA